MWQPLVASTWSYDCTVPDHVIHLTSFSVRELQSLEGML
jgi:hypothetical protein